MTARFKEIDGGFDLMLGDRVVLRHLIDAPAFRIARSHPTVKMMRGNFWLEDAPSDERVLGHASAVVHGWALADELSGIPLLNIFIDPIEGPFVDFCASDLNDNRLTIDFHLEPDEIIWGGGEQMSHLVLNGRLFPMWTSEPGVGREPGTALTNKMNSDGSMAGGDYWTTNYPQPTILSSRGYAIHLETSRYCEIDLTCPGRLRWHCWQPEASFRLTDTSSPAEAVAALSNRFGREQVMPPWPSPPPPIPDWAIGGAIIGLKDGANSFDRLEKIIAAGAAVSGLWCEDWVGIRQTSFGRRLFWDWQWNAERYPDLPAKIAELKARGIRFLGYVNPYLAIDGPQYAEAEYHGFLALKIESDDPYTVDFGEFDAGIVDFTNRAAAEWFSEEIIGKQMLDFGLDGWMADFGEYLPVDLRLHAGDPMEHHNQWPVSWAWVNREAIESRDKVGDTLWFMRAGWSGVQGVCPLLWAGDQSVDFSRHDGIGTVITAALTAGLVGNAFSHSDVGGYTSLHGNVRTEELMQRWYELAAFTPVMRTHEGNRPDDNLQIDSTPKLLAGFARWSRVHAALAPWVRHLCDEAATTGLPAQRALFLHYPQDRETFTIQDQYLYGADLMVAPVIEKGAVSRRLYLPEGEWVHLWNGERFGAGWHDVDAPIGSPPVFWRDGSDFAELFAGLLAVRNSI